jgi:hypothetical protein
VHSTFVVIEAILTGQRQRFPKACLNIQANVSAHDSNPAFSRELPLVKSYNMVYAPYMYEVLEQMTLQIGSRNCAMRKREPGLTFNPFVDWWR